jgi:hypothetical protein
MFDAALRGFSHTMQALFETPQIRLGGVDMATQAAVVSRQSQRRFYTGIAVVIAGIVFAGFARTYYLRGFFTTEPLSGLLHLHGLVFTSWLLLFVTQTTLVAAGRTDIHRRLGVAGGVLAATMLVVGVLTAIHAAQRGGTPLGMPPLRFIAIPLGDLSVFSILVTAALLYRRKPEIHKRLMLCATIAILAPATSRLPFAFIRHIGPVAFFGLADLVLLACIVYDLVSRRKVHPAYWWAAFLIVASQPLRLILSGTHAWLAFAQWLTR